MWTISISFVYIELLAEAFSESHRLKFTYCLKSLLSLAFHFLLVCMVDHTKILEDLICNIERLKGEPWSSDLPGGQGNLRPLFIPWLFYVFQDLS